MKVFVAQLNPTVGDLPGNTEKIIRAIDLAKSSAADIVVFPELCLTGYQPEDLLFNQEFIEAHEVYLKKIVEASSGILLFLGTLRKNTEGGEKPLFNSCAIIHDQKWMGFYDKWLLPTYDVFDERRYFEPGSRLQVIDFKGKKIGITICEDIWQYGKNVPETSYESDPIKEISSYPLDLLINISASPYHYNKPAMREDLCLNIAKALHCPVIQCCQVGANDQIVYDGHSVFVSDKQGVIYRGKGFEEDLFLVDTLDLKKGGKPSNPIEDLFLALVVGVRDYFQKQGFQKACLGLSGGIDSALVACIAKEALGKENVLGVAMPSRFSSDQSLSDAKDLAMNLGIDFIKIGIEEVFTSYLATLNPIFKERPFDTTEENLQSRIRGMYLMALSNKLGYLVLSTGNKSELAMGYCTLYGDMCGALSVIGDVTKTQVYALVSWINREKEIIPKSTIDRAPTAELRPNQKDSDSLPQFAILDEVIALYIEENLTPQKIAERTNTPQAFVREIIRRIHFAEYKRRQAAPLIRISKKTFKEGRDFPIVQKWVR